MYKKINTGYPGPKLGDSLRSDIPRMAGVFFDTGRFAYRSATPHFENRTNHFKLTAFLPVA